MYTATLLHVSLYATSHESLFPSITNLNVLSFPYRLLLGSRLDPQLVVATQYFVTLLIALM